VGPDEVVVGDRRYALRSDVSRGVEEGQFVFPRSERRQEPVVQVGQVVKKKELLARGTTHIFFQANVWVFTALVFVVGIAMGIGKAAVYRYIPDYFPGEVGVVGGIVGVIGGLGGFVCPILFGYLLGGSGLWTSCWMFLFALSAGCLLWLHLVVRALMRERAPQLAEQLEGHGRPAPVREAGAAAPEVA
jgi:NNP family nitrate/nitrite transporter-like MFS transporter